MKYEPMKSDGYKPKFVMICLERDEQTMMRLCSTGDGDGLTGLWYLDQQTERNCANTTHDPVATGTSFWLVDHDVLVSFQSCLGNIIVA